MAKLNTRLFLEGREVDLNGNIEIPINISIDDVTSFGKIQSPYTKTITLPGTNNNSQLLNFLYDIKSTGPTYAGQTIVPAGVPNIGEYLDVKKKVKASVIQDGLEIFRGYAKIISAKIVNGLTSFNIQITSTLTSFIADMGDKTLLDIPSSLTDQYTHELNFDTVPDSWYEPPATSYFYPMIDRGFTKGGTVNGTSWYLSYFVPALFVKQYIDLIFAANGYTYTSNFMDTDYFKRLFIPYNGESFTLKGIPATMGTAYLTNNNYAQSPTMMTVFNTEVSDPSSYISFMGSPVFGLIYTTPRTGNYSFNLKLNYQLTFAPTPIAMILGNTPISTVVQYKVYSSTGTLKQVLIASDSIKEGEYQINGNNGAVLVGSNPRIFSNSTLIFLEAGDYVVPTMYLQSFYPNTEIFKGYFLPGFDVPGTIGAALLAPTQLEFIQIPDNTDFSTLTYQDFAIRDVKQIDLLNSVFKLFNLYPEESKDIPKHIEIKTREEYFANQNVIDWTDKFDLKSETEITNIPNLTSSVMYFSYKKDEDYWNKRYSDLYSGIYGDRVQEIDYEFSNERKDVLDKVIFSPTPVVEYVTQILPCEETCEILVAEPDIIQTSGFSVIEGDELPTDGGFEKARYRGKISYYGAIYEIIEVISPFQFKVDSNLIRPTGNVDGTFVAVADTFSYVIASDKIIPQIYQSDDNNVTRKSVKSNPRILVYNGVRSSEYYNFQETPVLNGKTYVAITGSYLMDTYPFSSHMRSDAQTTDGNTVEIPVTDLLFSVPKAVFFNPTYNYENIPNLYDLYWSGSVAEIADSEAKMCTTLLKLNSLDISNLDLSDNIFIDGTMFRVNKIVDYTPDDSVLTKVQLIRKPFSLVPDNPIFDTTTTQAPTTTAAPSTTTGAPTSTSGGPTLSWVLDSMDPDIGNNAEISFLKNGSPIDSGSGDDSGSFVIAVGNSVQVYLGYSSPAPLPAVYFYLSIYNTTTETSIYEGTSSSPITQSFSITGNYNYTITARENTVPFGTTTLPPTTTAAPTTTTSAPTTTTAAPTTTTAAPTTTTLAPTTTLPPENDITFDICGGQTGFGECGGAVFASAPVNTNVTVALHMTDDLGNDFYPTCTIFSGNTTNTWSQNIDSFANFNTVEVLYCTPSSNAGQNFLPGIYLGTC